MGKSAILVVVFTMGCVATSSTDPGGEPGPGSGVVDGAVQRDRVSDNAIPRTKRVFVTGQRYQGFLINGIQGGYAICNAAAASAALPGEYLPWLSSGIGGGWQPLTGFAVTPGPYIDVNGDLIANSFADLTDGILTHPIDITETGQPLVPQLGGCGLNQVWTATTNTGYDNVTGDCENWSGTPTNPGWGGIGLADSVSTAWTQYPCGGPSGAAACYESASIYCFEQ